MSGFNPARKATPRGQMSSSQNSGPAVMLMPPEIRSTFMPNPPLEPIASISYRRRNTWTGVAQYMVHMETTKVPPERIILPTPKSIREQRKKIKMQQHQESLLPSIQQFRHEQKDVGGEYKNMNCYNTLFIGRLSYEVTERKLLREMEAFGPIKDIHIIKERSGNDNNNNNNNNDDTMHVVPIPKSRGYAFVEYEHEDDMKRAYRAMDGVRMEGRDIVVDVERGHTVPDFLPRRLGGGLGGTRLGSKDRNVTRPGRYDPTRTAILNPPVIVPTTSMNHLPPPSSSLSMNTGGGGMGRGMGGPSQMSTPYGPGPIYGGGGGGGGMGSNSRGESDSRYGEQQRDWNNNDRNGGRSNTRGGGGGGGGDNTADGSSRYDDRNKRRRSHSPPDQRYGGGGGGGTGGGNRRPRY